MGLSPHVPWRDSFSAQGFHSFFTERIFILIFLYINKICQTLHTCVTTFTYVKLNCHLLIVTLELHDVYKLWWLYIINKTEMSLEISQLSNIVALWGDFCLFDISSPTLKCHVPWTLLLLKYIKLENLI